MELPDVNVLVGAYRDDAPDHARCRRWLDRAVAGAEAFALSDIALSGFVRIVTHPRVFALPSGIEEALRFTAALREQPHAVSVAPGARHWEIFARMCRDAQARGNLVPDAFLAAIAVEHGCEFVTLDRDFSRFAPLRWKTPS